MAQHLNKHKENFTFTFCKDSSNKNKEYRISFFLQVMQRQMMLRHIKMKLSLKRVIIVNWWTLAVPKMRVISPSKTPQGIHTQSFMP
jgi:hypothetical protein